MSTRANKIVALRLQKLAWITNESDGLRWAAPSDLACIVNIALKAFGWSHDPTMLQQMWAQRIEMKTFVVLEQQGKIEGFMEVLWGDDNWCRPARMPIRQWLQEWIARRLLCNRRYSEDGPYIFLIARHPNSPKGIGSTMVRDLQKHHDVVSVMYERGNTRLGAYYKTLGFSEQRNPLLLVLRQIVGRKYVYATWRAKAYPV